MGLKGDAEALIKQRNRKQRREAKRQGPTGQVGSWDRWRSQVESLGREFAAAARSEGVSTGQDWFVYLVTGDTPGDDHATMVSVQPDGSVVAPLDYDDLNSEVVPLAQARTPGDLDPKYGPDYVREQFADALSRLIEKARAERR